MLVLSVSRTLTWILFIWRFALGNEGSLWRFNVLCCDSDMHDVRVSECNSRIDVIFQWRHRIMKPRFYLFTWTSSLKLPSVYVVGQRRIFERTWKKSWSRWKISSTASWSTAAKVGQLLHPHYTRKLLPVCCRWFNRSTIKWCRGRIRCSLTKRKQFHFIFSRHPD